MIETLPYTLINFDSIHKMTQHKSVFEEHGCIYTSLVHSSLFLQLKAENQWTNISLPNSKAFQKASQDKGEIAVNVYIAASLEVKDHRDNSRTRESLGAGTRLYSKCLFTLATF